MVSCLEIQLTAWGSTMMRRNGLLIALGLVTAGASTVASAQSQPFTTTELANFDVPWALEFLPDGRLLVTEQRGAIKLYTPGSGAMSDIKGVPAVSYGGQG